MLVVMQDILDEMDGLPKYFQKRAARKMQKALRETVIEMLLTDYESRTVYEGKPWVSDTEREKGSRDEKRTRAR